MKMITAVFFTCLLCPAASFSQVQTKNGFVFQNANTGLGVGMGQEIAANLFITASFQNTFYAGFNFLTTSVHSRDVPADYISGTHLFTSSTRVPRDHFTARSLVIGKRFQQHQSTFFVSFETGIAFIKYNIATFTRKSNTPGFFGPSSDFDGYQVHHTTGLLLNGRLGHRLGTGTNLELSTYANINATRFVIVENLSVVFDVFRKHTTGMK